MPEAPTNVHEHTQLAARLHVGRELHLSYCAIEFEDAYADIEQHGMGWVRFLVNLSIIRPNESAPMCLVDVMDGHLCIRNAGHPEADRHGWTDGHRTRI